MKWNFDPNHTNVSNLEGWGARPWAGPHQDPRLHSSADPPLYCSCMEKVKGWFIHTTFSLLHTLTYILIILMPCGHVYMYILCVQNVLLDCFLQSCCGYSFAAMRSVYFLFTLLCIYVGQFLAQFIRWSAFLYIWNVGFTSIRAS